MTGAPCRDGLGSAEAPEPCGLGPTGAIPSAFTKGPWSFTRYGYEKHAIADDRGTEIGFVHRARDARLIAAAPEMFEALYSIAVLVNAGTIEGLTTEAVEAIGLADTLTAKARGEQVQS